jgi:RNA polymerase sigma-70 factor (ECF subfamily)
MRPGITSDAAITPAFVRQLTDAQFALLSYIMLLTGSSADARDILQDTNLTIIKDAAHYRVGTPFLAWAKTLAYYQVLTYRKKKSRDRLVFDDEVFDRLSVSCFMIGLHFLLEV